VLELHHGLVSTASERTRLVLAEKRLAWTSHPIDLSAGGQNTPEYRALNPKGQVPCLVHDGFALRESSVIAEYLDEVFPDVPLRPVDPRWRARARLWDKTIDEVHPPTGVLTYAIAFRPMLLGKPKAELDALVAAITDPARRTARQSVLDHGVDAPEVRPALAAYVALLNETEAQLAQTPFLAGDAFSTADTAVIPFLTRIEHLGMGEMIDAKPHTRAWLETVQARESFATAVTSVVPAAVVQMFGVRGAEVWPAMRGLLG
jgi:glutathione S-transferase